MNIPLKNYKDYLMKEVFAPMFEQEGFSLSGRTFTKQEDTFTRVFNIQISEFNNYSTFSFFLNVGLFFPNTYNFRLAEFFDLEKLKIPQSVKINHCQFAIRAKDLIPNYEPYAVGPNTDQEVFTDRVHKEMDVVVMPYLKSLAKLDDCLLLTQPYTPPNQLLLDVAIAQLHLDNLAKGSQLLESYLSVTKLNDEQYLQLKKKVADFDIEF